MAKIKDALTGRYISDHGMRFSKEYRTWRGIINRCHNPKCPEFPRYGGAGLVVSDHWRESFVNFYNDIGAAPSPRHTIDRINNSLGYSRENCRWATMKEQQNNKTNNKIWVIDGVSKTTTQWCELYNIDTATFSNRIRRRWDVKRALSESPETKYLKKCPHLKGLDPLTFNGETKPLNDFCKKYNIARETFKARIAHGWSVEDALRLQIYRGPLKNRQVNVT